MRISCIKLFKFCHNIYITIIGNYIRGNESLPEKLSRDVFIFKLVMNFMKQFNEKISSACTSITTIVCLSNCFGTRLVLDFRDSLYFMLIYYTVILRSSCISYNTCNLNTVCNYEFDSLNVSGCAPKSSSVFWDIFIV